MSAVASQSSQTSMNAVGSLTSQKSMHSAGLRRPVKIVDPKAAMRYQLRWTLCGSFVLFACITVMGIIWIVNWRQTELAMDNTSEKFRWEQAHAMHLELAALLRPLYVTAQRFATQLEFTDLRAKLIQPDFYSSKESLNELEPLLYSVMKRETQVRTMNADGSGRVLNNYMGLAVALALDENNSPTSALDMQTCSKAVLTSVVLDNPDPTSNGYLIDVQSLDATGALSRKFYALNTDTCTVGDLVTEKPVLPCAGGLAPLWQGFRPDGFDNFTWFGPHDPGIGWGNLFVGGVPLYDDGRRMVGRVGLALSLGKSVTPMLERILALGGDMTKGGHCAVYTESGLVIGLTEAGASADGVEQAPRLEEVVEGSSTGRALVLLMETSGTYCPDEQQLINADGTLVDVTPFRAETFGMPPFEEKWCQLVVVPRKNVFAAIDAAATSGIAMGVMALMGFVLAVLMLMRSLLLTYRAHMQMNRERKAHLQERVMRADSLLSHLGAPMAVMSANHFLALSEPECFEDCRDSGKLLFLDSVQMVRSFQMANNAIVLFSHQWLGFDYPDTEDHSQLKTMQSVVRKLREMFPQKNIHVWLDYISVPQRMAQMLGLAVSSLPTYVSLVDYFVICAPDAEHRDSGELCNLTSYSRRGWCRAEMLAKACSSGVRNMFICCGDGRELKAYGREDFEKISLKVFEGNFTVRQDMDSLVEPILGLHACIIRQAGVAHIDVIREEIEREKESFFPTTYNPNPEGKSNRHRVLFGPLVQEMEDHVSRVPRQPEAAVTESNHAFWRVSSLASWNQAGLPSEVAPSGAEAAVAEASGGAGARAHKVSTDAGRAALPETDVSPGGSRPAFRSLGRQSM